MRILVLLALLVGAAAARAQVIRDVGEVVATTTRAERGNLELPGNITVLDREAIEASGARDVPDLLRREAGLFVTNDQTNPEGYRIEARGFNNGGGNGQGTLVLVDGRRATEPETSTSDWALIRLDEVERIEIVRGPVNAAWGDNAQAGVINIVTRSGEGPLRFETRGRTGSYDTLGGSLFAGGSHGPVRASLFLDRYDSGGYRERSAFDDHGGTLKLGFDLGERARLDLKGGYSSDMRERPGNLSRMQIDTLGRRAAEPSADDNFVRARTHFTDASLEVFLSDSVSFQTLGWYRGRKDTGALGTSEFAFDSLTESWVVGSNSQVEVDHPVFGHANQLVVGGDFLREKVDFASLFDFFAFPPPTESDTRADRHLWGVFLQDDLDLTEDLILSAGVRYDRNRRDGDDRIAASAFDVQQSAWSPRAGLTWRVAEPVSLYASYARGFRLPNLAESFGFFGITPGLDPEKSDSYELGAKLRSDHAAANLAFYHMDVFDEIFLDPEAAPPLGRNVNLDRVQHRGVELSGNLRPWEWLEVYGSYTYDDVEIREDMLTGLAGMRMPMVPRHRGTAGFRVFLPCDLEAGLNGNFVGERFLVNDVANRFAEQASFAVYDAHLAWRPKLGEHVRFGVEGNVYNLFDREYSEVAGIRTTCAAFAPDFTCAAFARERRFNPSPGRNWEVRAMVEITR